MRPKLRTLTRALVFLSFVLPALHGQASVPVAEEFEKLHFRSIGPAIMSGRISDLAVYEAKPTTFYVGTAHGGVWKTTNNGTLFTPLMQTDGLLSIGDVAVSQTNPDVVWVGTGEPNNRQSTSWGDGVLKSTDGGRTFTMTSSSSPRRARFLGRVANAACTRRATAVRPGARSSRSTIRPAPTISP